MKELSTVDDIIKMFDGPSKAARWAKVSDQAVCLWRTREAIPPSTHLRLIIAARKRGYVISKDLLRLDEDDWKELYQLMPNALTAPDSEAAA